MSVFILRLAISFADFRLRWAQLVAQRRNARGISVNTRLPWLAPEERFANHKRGIKAAAAVQRDGVRLLPELYAHLNPMPFEAAAAMEEDLAEDLRHEGYAVTGGY